MTQQNIVDYVRVINNYLHFKMINMYECVFVECAIQNTGCRTHCTVVDVYIVKLSYLFIVYSVHYTVC